MTRTRALLAGFILLPLALWTTGPFMLTGYWQSWPSVHNERVVALTFDDGPNPVYTPQVLEILKSYDAKATFFVTGASVAKHPDIARQMVAQGHEIGDHSEHHQYKLPFLLPSQVRRDYRGTQDAIYNATGVMPVLYRAPHGRISPWMGLALRHEGANIIGWDVSAGDWHSSAAGVLVQRVSDRVRPGSIILLHDGLNLDDRANRDVVVQALPGIIGQLRHRGYRFTTVSELLNTGRHQFVVASE